MKNDNQNNKTQAEEFFNSAIIKYLLGHLEDAITDYNKAIEQGGKI